MVKQSEYNFQKIENKWQKIWENKKAFVSKENVKGKKKYYVLDMFPYPSGEGLHMGHAFVFSLGDIYARFKRLQGYNVLYPIGYDSFGLPAENAAIKAGVLPQEYTKKSMANFMRQQKAMGWGYDWTRLVMAHAPEFYRWDQWIFLKMLEKGLAYRKKSAVNYCSKCQTVLANEQVVQGMCWRHDDTKVEIKQLEQWYLKITDYAEELLQGLDKLDWPERAKLMQRNWIGKSEGAEILFEVENQNSKISNVVIVHGVGDGVKDKTFNKHWMPWVKKELEKKKIKVDFPVMRVDETAKYIHWKSEFEKIKIDENSVLIGHSRGTAFLVRWLGETGKKIKKLILVAPWKISDKPYKEDFYDFKINNSVSKQVSEIVMFTSDNEEEDGKESVKIYHNALGGKIIELKNHGHFDLEGMGTEEFPELLNEITSNEKWPIFTTRPDTIYGATFMVVSAQHSRLMELVTEKQKAEVEKFTKKLGSVSEKELEGMDKEGVFTGSYAINPMTNEKIPVYVGNFVLADYGSGMVMAVPAHDSRDYDFAKKYKLQIKQVIEGGDTSKSAYQGIGKLINSGAFNDLQSDEAKEHIIKHLEEKNLGKKTVQFKLRDWLISRQRYWGTPIPVVYCDKCGIVSVPEKELPIKLPKEVKFGKGNPLASNNKWINTKCPKCKGKARRETDTMDTFVNSSWYYLRYCDPRNKKMAFDPKKANYWCPIDQYIGGPEHITMHLIYIRFYAKFLRDLGLLKFDEPALRYFTQGIVKGSDGNRMSKSKGNVIEPLKTIEKYGADSLRLFLMSASAADSDINWDEKGIEGSCKFVNKVYEYFSNLKLGKVDVRVESKLNKTIKEVSHFVEYFKHNLAVIQIRGLFDYIGERQVDKKTAETFLQLLHIYCPFVTEELWQKIKGKGLISVSSWPKVDEKKINLAYEKEEEAVNNLVNDINNVKKFVEKANKACVYVIPNELTIYSNNINEILKRINLQISIYAVNDKNKYDPNGKASKAKPGKPGIYLE